MSTVPASEWVDQNTDRLTSVSDSLWESPELGLHEDAAVNQLTRELSSAGFTVTRDIAGMSTAFVATYGDGSPRIGILGEYDALPRFSQAVVAEPSPIKEGAPGHGCGHNLLGAGTLGGALVAQNAIEATDNGTVVYLGCPAEELLVGKVYMAQAGVFDDLDAAISWHPGGLTHPWRASTLAADSIQFTFDGVAAHAAGSPDAGRSALDAVQLLNTGVEYVREHVPESVRIHYVITNGGDTPNVVPAEAEVWYYVRAPSRQQVDRVSDWVRDAASAAAQMTQTELRTRFVSGCYEFLPNQSLNDVVFDAMQTVKPTRYSSEDRAFAADLKSTLDSSTIDGQLSPLPDDLRRTVSDNAIYEHPIDFDDPQRVVPISTDVGDVSWITPTAMFRVATWPVGTPSHSWQAVAANGSFGTKGMLTAASIIGETVSNLLTDKSSLEAVRAEFQRERSDWDYNSPLPAGTTPPVDVMS